MEKEEQKGGKDECCTGLRDRTGKNAGYTVWCGGNGSKGKWHDDVDERTICFKVEKIQIAMVAWHLSHALSDLVDEGRRWTVDVIYGCK